MFAYSNWCVVGDPEVIGYFLFARYPLKRRYTTFAKHLPDRRPASFARRLDVAAVSKGAVPVPRKSV